MTIPFLPAERAAFAPPAWPPPAWRAFGAAFRARVRESFPSESPEPDRPPTLDRAEREDGLKDVSLYSHTKSPACRTTTHIAESSFRYRIERKPETHHLHIW